MPQNARYIIEHIVVYPGAAGKFYSRPAMLQPENALSPINAMPEGVLIEVMLQPNRRPSRFRPEADTALFYVRFGLFMYYSNIWF
jgi:hypothetical protein